jgi:hypothetical protein
VFEGNWNERFLLCHTNESAYILLFDYTRIVLLTLGGYIRRFVIEKDMPFYCVAGNCTNKACLKDGISLHNIPYFNDEHAEAKRQRKVRVDFVCAKRLFVPPKTSTICSDYCRTEDYERQFFLLPGLGKPNYPKL